MKLLTTTRAQEIASYWHAGDQKSALYQFAKTGAILPENISRYHSEVDAFIKQSEETATKLGQLNIRRLKRYFNSFTQNTL